MGSKEGKCGTGNAQVMHRTGGDLHGAEKECEGSTVHQGQPLELV